MNCVVNATGEWIKDDYIKLHKVGTCMAMQTKTWMISFLFKNLKSFFKKSILNEISQSN
jgi:IS4 transposase